MLRQKIWYNEGGKAITLSDQETIDDKSKSWENLVKESQQKALEAVKGWQNGR